MEFQLTTDVWLFLIFIILAFIGFMIRVFGESK